MWSTVCNLTGHQYLVNTLHDPLWYLIDLATTDFASSRLVALPTGGTFTPFVV